MKKIHADRGLPLANRGYFERGRAGCLSLGAVHGYSEEVDGKLTDQGRRLGDRPLSETAALASAYPKREGYLLTARGNPFEAKKISQKSVGIFSILVAADPSLMPVIQPV